MNIKSYKNKCIFFVIMMLILVSFLGCSQGTTNKEAKKVTIKTTSESKETQAELNQKIKSEAVKADFVQLNGHEDEFKGKSYWIEGKITNVDNTNSVLPMFTVETTEGDGFGMYDILNFSKVDVKQGDRVKVYGGLTGKSKVGAPEFSGNVIEKLEAK